MSEPWQTAGFGLYIHWPYCTAKCPYCDFNSHVSASIDQSRWAGAYVREIERTAEETEGRTLSTVFFGGGTPSLMAPDLVNDILSAARNAWPVSNNFEVTLEANPTSVEAGRFRGYRDAGVNRVSIGVQSLRDEALKALGRLHSVDEAKAALAVANSVFPRVSFDLIYARQEQSLADWREELAEAIQLATGHLSLYQLTIEPGTAFGDRFRRGRLPGLPTEDLGADLFELTQEMCDAAGLPAYEISNHATPGQESRHNLIYWRSGDYVGIGPGAHGRLTVDGLRIATSTHRNPNEWLNAVDQQGTGERPRETLSKDDTAIECVMMGMRTSDGIRLSEAKNYSNNIKSLEELGLVSASNDRLVITPTGRPLLNAVLRELLA